MNIPIDATANPERRLSAIFIVQLANEETVSSGTAAYYTETLLARTAHHRGVVLHSAVSLALVEFAEATDAVNCAMDLQERFSQYNKLHPDGGPIDAKIGIHYGEVFYSGGELKGTGVAILAQLLSAIPAHKIHITREVYARVRMHLPLKLEDLGKKNLPGSPEPKEILSVVWEAVAGNLQASLKKLGEDDLQRVATLSSKFGFDASKRVSPIVPILLFVFLYILFKILKWF